MRTFGDNLVEMRGVDGRLYVHSVCAKWLPTWPDLVFVPLTYLSGDLLDLGVGEGEFDYDSFLADGWAELNAKVGLSGFWKTHGIPALNAPVSAIEPRAVQWMSVFNFPGLVWDIE